jgi:pilus assembly protein CpaB
MVNVILEKVQVLAIDLRAGEGNTEAALGKTATLQVTPRDAQKLVLATQVGRLSLALRNVEDVSGSSKAIVSTRDLGGGLYIRARPAAAAPQQVAAVSATTSPGVAVAAVPRRPSGPSMTVVRGTTANVEEVQRHGY